MSQCQHSDDHHGESPDRRDRTIGIPDFGKQWREWGIRFGGTPATHEDMLTIGDEATEHQGGTSHRQSAKPREP